MRINSFVPIEQIFNDYFGTNGVINDNNSQKVDFVDTLKGALDEINSQQIASDNITEAFVRGDDNVTIEDTMLMQTEAKLSLQLAVQVRNKLVEGYKELIKMQM